jgi:hypothetical protein
LLQQIGHVLCETLFAKDDLEVAGRSDLLQHLQLREISHCLCSTMGNVSPKGGASLGSARRERRGTASAAS